jgi:VWFA-related protein
MRAAPTAALALLAGALAMASASQDIPTFATGVEAIRVDVRVTRGERVVLGLQAADFEVRDNGVLQDVELISSENMPVNVILALDTSGSVAGEALEQLRTAGQALLARLRPEDRAGLVTFSHEVTLREGLTRDRDRLRVALTEVQARGETAVIDGSYAAMMVGEADVGRDLMIVFSDGVDTSSWLTDSQVLEAARRSEVIVYGVSVRGTVEPKFLSRLTQIAGGALLEVESMRDLSAAFVGILDEFRSRYVLSYSPKGVSGGGWHPIEVKIKGGRGIARSRAGYVRGADLPAGQPPSGAVAPADPGAPRRRR